MTAFERVTELKKEGISEGDITAKLKAEGISPMEIDDALNQAKIKDAVGEKDPTEGMQPSIMKEENAAPGPAPAPAQTPAPIPATTPLPISTPEEENMNQAQPPETMPQEYVPQQAAPPQEYPPQEYPPQQYNPQPNYSQTNIEPEADYYSPEDSYAGEGEYTGYSQGNTGTDTMIEIAEQVFSQKMESISKEIKTLIEFKTIYSSKIDDVNQRLKRIENQFDKMQIAILDKVGKFGKNLDSLKKEIDMVEDSFSKMNSRL